MAKTPTSIEIRSYQVGFGDCFLLSFHYATGKPKHVLIDFGSTGLPKRGKTTVKPSQYMPMIAQNIADVCDGERLTAVIATHRHADHINGFATDGKSGGSGDIIRALRPKVVIQPWTEDPNAKRDARKATSTSLRSRKGFTAALRSKQEVARMIHELAEEKPRWMSAALQKELSFLGQENIANESAVSNLIAMGKAKGARAVYARHGSSAGLARLLPGVKVTVLGPPDLTQTEGIKKQRSRDPDQFWHLMAGTGLKANRNVIANGLSRNGGQGTLPIESRWFRYRLDRMRGAELLEIVRTLDDELNNTSLILLFEVGSKKLLFPGDAQIENWTYALQDAPNAKATRSALAGVDVLKVGHHGSLNATPRKLLWETLSKRGSGKKLKTLLSTMPGKHGKTASKTEVPRRTLLDALKSESELTNTQTLSFAAKTFEICHLVTIKP